MNVFIQLINDQRREKENLLGNNSLIKNEKAPRDGCLEAHHDNAQGEGAMAAVVVTLSLPGDRRLRNVWVYDIRNQGFVTLG